MVYPSLLLIYLGQAAYLAQHTGSYSSLYYSSIPTPVFWPMFVLALLASIVASQSIITGTALTHLSVLSRKLHTAEGCPTLVQCLCMCPTSSVALIPVH